jgi:hypothetical protein
MFPKKVTVAVYTIEYSVTGSSSCKVVQGAKDVGAITVNVPDVQGPGVNVPFPLLEVAEGEGIHAHEFVSPGSQVWEYDWSLVLLSAVGVKGWAKPWCGLLCIEAWISPFVSSEIASWSRFEGKGRVKMLWLAEVADTEITWDNSKELDSEESRCADKVTSVLGNEVVKSWSNRSAVNDNLVFERSCCVDGVIWVLVDKVVKFLSSSVVVRGRSSTTSLQEPEVASITNLSRLSTEEVWLIGDETEVSCDVAVAVVVGRVGIDGDKRVVLPSGAVAITVSFRGKRLRLWSASARGKAIPAADGTSVAIESSAMVCTALMMSVYSYRLYGVLCRMVWNGFRSLSGPNDFVVCTSVRHSIPTKPA